MDFSPGGRMFGLLEATDANAARWARAKGSPVASLTPG